MKKLLFIVALYIPFAHTADMGLFAPKGYIGSMANTLTLIQAQGKCLNEMGVGSSPSESSTPFFDNSFKNCMKDYVPFRSSDADSGNLCGSQTVTWGQCSGVTNPLQSGNTAFVRNTGAAADYTGYANFMCANGQMIFMSGGCSRTTDACEEGIVEQWPVTFPSWADADPSTVYRDKYGQVRNYPQPNCAARLRSANSGEFLVQPITPDVTDVARYTNDSRAPLRCFNGEWDLEPPESAICEIKPRGCEARSVNYNGCQFSIPATAHDEIFSDTTPLPILSVGHVEAYCFDGNLEIKQRSCVLSCDANQERTTWAADDSSVSESCAHDELVGQGRIASGVTQEIENNVAGMTGVIARQCVNGVMGVTSTSCEPEACDELPAKSWGEGCAHNAQKITSSYDKNNIVVPSSTNIFEWAGSITYSCEFGEFVEKSNNCGETSTPPECIDPSISLPPSTPPSPGEPVDPGAKYCETRFGRSGMVQVGNDCCTGRPGNLLCYKVP